MITTIIIVEIKCFTSVFGKDKTLLSSRCDAAQRGESDIPPDRGELKGGKVDEHTNFATFFLAGIIN